MNNEQSTQVGTNFLTNDQIAAGAAIECDHGAPIGRNVAIDVFDAMHAAAPVAAQADQVAPADLHDAIMRLPCDATRSMFSSKSEMMAYKEGHRDARHAAADLAAGVEAGQVAVPEGWSVEKVGDAIHITRADGKWCGYMPEIGPAAALTFEFLAAMLAAAPSAPAVAQQAPDHLEQLIIEKRIGITPENEGGFHAAIYGDDERPQEVGYGQTPMEAIKAARPAQQTPAQAEPAPAESIECWSHNEEDFNALSLTELVSDHELQPGATVWVGDAVHPEPGSLFNTDWLIESMGEAAYDIGGEHAGEDYPNVSDEQVAELETLIVGWIAKCAPPNFWTVKNVRPYVLTAEDCGAQASTPDARQEGGDRG